MLTNKVFKATVKRGHRQDKLLQQKKEKKKFKKFNLLDYKIAMCTHLKPGTAKSGVTQIIHLASHFPQFPQLFLIYLKTHLCVMPTNSRTGVAAIVIKFLLICPRLDHVKEIPSVCCPRSCPDILSNVTKW